jgi:hypothetical protein
MFRNRRNTASLFSFLSLATLLLLALTACPFNPFSYTKIGDILKDPTAYEGRIVEVKGKVTDIVKLPVFQTKFYTINDGTGEITIVTNEESPAMYAEVRVKARVENTAIIGGTSIGVHLIELKRV